MFRKWGPWAALGMVVLALFVRYGNLAHPPLQSGDEALTALRARGLIEHGHFWTPYWNGTINLHKPPFYYWFVALGYQVLGENEVAVRLPSVLFFVLLLGLVFLMARRIWGAWAGVVAALGLSLHPTFVAQSRLGMMDTLVTLLVMAGGYCLWQVRGERKRYYYLWGAACGCALLTKGGGAIYCVPVSLLYLAIARPAEFKKAHLYGGLALALFIPGVWFWNQWATHYEAFKMCYIDHEVNYRLQGHNVWSTFLEQKTTLKLWQSFGVLAPLCVVGSGLAFLGKSVRRGGWRVAVFLPVFLVVAMVLTNLVKQQMYWYILPGVVPLVVLAAGAVVAAVRRELPLWASGVLIVCLGAGLLWCRPDRVNLSTSRGSGNLKELASQIPEGGGDATPLVVDFRFYHMNVALFYSGRDRAEQARGFVPEPGRTYYGIFRKRGHENVAGLAVEVLDAKGGFTLAKLSPVQ